MDQSYDHHRPQVIDETQQPTGVFVYALASAAPARAYSSRRTRWCCTYGCCGEWVTPFDFTQVHCPHSSHLIVRPSAPQTYEVFGNWLCSTLGAESSGAADVTSEANRAPTSTARAVGTGLEPKGGDGGWLRLGIRVLAASEVPPEGNAEYAKDGKEDDGGDDGGTAGVATLGG